MLTNALWKKAALTITPNELPRVTQRTGANSMTSRPQFLQERPRLLQIERVEAFGEPAANRMSALHLSYSIISPCGL
jgi:hypothetical protein